MTGWGVTTDIGAPFVCKVQLLSLLVVRCMHETSCELSISGASTLGVARAFLHGPSQRPTSETEPSFMPLTLRSNRQLAPPTPPLNRTPPLPAEISLPGSSKRKRLSPVASVVQRLHDRATDGRGRASFPKRCVRERFAHLQTRVQIDLFSMQHLPAEQRAGLDNLLTFRHRISEICVAEGVVLALTDNGLCAAYCVRTSRQLCVLNADSKEVVRSLFHNKSNGAPSPRAHVARAHRTASCIRLGTLLTTLTPSSTTSAAATIAFQAPSLASPCIMPIGTRACAAARRRLRTSRRERRSARRRSSRRSR